LPEKVKRKK